MDRESVVTSDIIKALESLGSWRASRRVLFAVLMRQWPSQAKRAIADSDLQEAL